MQISRGRPKDVQEQVLHRVEGAEQAFGLECDSAADRPLLQRLVPDEDMKPDVDRKGWKLFQDTQGNCLFPIQGEEGDRDFILWLEHGDSRLCLQIPRAELVKVAPI